MGLIPSFFINNVEKERKTNFNETLPSRRWGAYWA